MEIEKEKITERITVEMTNGQFIFILIILFFVCALPFILVLLGEL
jgi:hypothetical protein